ncbi:extracellular solute-binding protein [Paenibacillus agaridevorans]|uniref:extracellular solute-binding protein n=1 Tax=Paenibacillus agaridevorans TaxID=171404 RepID=UPI001BE4738F|nr:extracellular solute-binding protein [Paenibacillus agaridevorans]
MLRKWMVYTALLALIVLGYAVRSWLQGEESFPVVSADAMDYGSGDGDGILFYADRLRKAEESGILPYTGPPVAIEPIAYSVASAEAAVRTGYDADLNEEVLHWTNGTGWVEWTVEIPADALYELELTYMPTKRDSSSSVFYALSIDGEIPFSEANGIELLKRWRDKDVPYRKDALGNEIRSMQVETVGWLTAPATNYAVSSVPLRLPLTKGVHTLRFAAQNEPMSWGPIRLTAPEAIPAYAEYLERAGTSEQAGAPERADAPPAIETWYTLLEGERYEQKSHPSVQTGTINEPNVSPDGEGRLLYNVLDGQRWKRAGEWAEWTFEVPSAGWYEIDVKYYQGFVGKANAFRTVLIDGKTPFEELLHYPFPYNSKLEMHTLGSRAGEPYRFYLDKGEHTLRLVTDISPLNPVVLSMQEAIRKLYGIEQKLRKLTGDYGTNTGDANRTWDIMSYFPDLEAQLAGLRDQLKLSMDYLNGLNGQTNDTTESLKIGVAILDGLLEEINQIPNRLGKFPDLQMRIGTWMDKMANGGMSADYIVVRSPSAVHPYKETSTLSKVPYTIINFARTFYLNYNARDLNDKDAIEIWVGRGRDYASLLQEMIDQSFTPQTGIAVNVNFMPDANALTLSNAGGDQPDVALGLVQDMPVDYAMREASVDLTQFANFKEVAERFHPGVMRSFGYKNGVYALPETQSYHLLFYRKSMMKELELEAPDTWEDLQRILPTLQENGMQFYYNAKDFVPFFYQNDVEFYSPDGMKAAFDTEAAYTSFSLWTELFGKYDLPQEVPAFFQHFKLGTMPIGVSDFNTYVQLLTSAPEILGDWEIAPMPGTVQEDGSVARWAMNTMTSAMILNKSDKKEQAWRFIDWWTSTDVQLEYGNAIESFYGPEYRWNTANMKAMAAMPWPAEHIAAIKEQNRWNRNVPFLPGGYLLAREMEFAFNRTIVQKIPAKDSLDTSFVAMAREMARKQQDLGIRNGQQLDFPVVDQPYDWGEAPK